MRTSANEDHAKPMQEELVEKHLGGFAKIGAPLIYPKIRYNPFKGSQRRVTPIFENPHLWRRFEWPPGK